MKKIYKMLVDLEQELRTDKVHSAADKLLPILKEVKKYISCEDCQDSVIEPKNCHGTCRGNLYRELKNAARKAKIAENRKADSEFIHARKYSKIRAEQARAELSAGMKRFKRQ